MHTQDPTSEEMLAFLLSQPCRSEEDRNDALVAIYWFASEWHGGQTSNLYSALSTSPFRPGPCGSLESEGETVKEFVADLEEKFAGVNHRDRNPCKLDAEAPVWMLWHGGSSYAMFDQFRREDCEPFANLDAALDEFESRAQDPYYPCVENPTAWICYADPFEFGDLYPDAVVEFNAHGIAVATSG